MQQSNVFSPSYKYQHPTSVQDRPSQVPYAPVLTNQAYGHEINGNYNNTDDEVYGGEPPSHTSQTFHNGLCSNYNEQFHSAPNHQALNDDGSEAFYKSWDHGNLMGQQYQQVGYETNQSNFHNEVVTFPIATTQQQLPYEPAASLHYTGRHLVKNHAPPPPTIEQQQYCMPMTIATSRQRQLQQPHYYVDRSGDYVDYNGTMNGFLGNFPTSQKMNNEYAQYHERHDASLSNNLPNLNELIATTAVNPQGVHYVHAETHQDCNSLSKYNSDASLINDNNAAPLYQMPPVSISGDMTATNAVAQFYDSNQANPCQFIVQNDSNQSRVPLPSSLSSIMTTTQPQISPCTTLSDENLPDNSDNGSIINIKKSVYTNCVVKQTSDANIFARQADGFRYLPEPTSMDSSGNHENLGSLTMKSNNSSTMNLTPSSINNRLAQKQMVARASNQQDYVEMRSSGNLSQEWLDTVCRYMIEHMDSFGICVIDNFLGSIKGEMILKEVKQLFSNRSYTTGRLVNDRLERGSNNTGIGQPRENKCQTKQAIVDPAKTIRNDRVIWVDGCEKGCEEINYLIQTLCSVITNSSRLSLYSDNGLDKVVISKRTKAHVACYPGNGTRYIKHVDNPNGDGRVITAIYYLNKSWDTKIDGGLLRMFPAGVDTVANIEPLFDRVLFFWSDRRNPHEVLPSYRDRFAITVWYIGESRVQET